MKQKYILYLLIFFLLCYLVIIFPKKREKKLEVWRNPPKLKILNLVLFSHSDLYDQMKKLSIKFHKKYDGFVDTLFYTYEPHLSQEYFLDLEKRMLYIQGKESYIPGILKKTVKAFHYVNDLERINNRDYDYIIRTNISTFVNFFKLEEMLIKDPIDYGAGWKLGFGKNWRDSYNGIHDERYADIPYPSGTSMIFSRNFFRKIMDKIDQIDDNVVDDVAIGKLVKIYLPGNTLHDYKPFYFHTDESITKIKEEEKEELKKYIFYRNKATQREKDIDIMKKLIEIYSIDIDDVKDEK